MCKREKFNVVQYAVIAWCDSPEYDSFAGILRSTQWKYCRTNGDGENGMENWTARQKSIYK